MDTFRTRTDLYYGQFSYHQSLPQYRMQLRLYDAYLCVAYEVIVNTLQLVPLQPELMYSLP